MRRSVVKLMLAGVMMVAGTAWTCADWCEFNPEWNFCDNGHETGDATGAAEEKSLAEADVEAELEELGLGQDAKGL